MSRGKSLSTTVFCAGHCFSAAVNSWGLWHYGYAAAIQARWQNALADHDKGCLCSSPKHPAD